MAKANFIWNSTDLAVDPSLLTHVGGKARQLYWLDQMGLKVPPWVVIPANYLNGLLPPEKAPFPQFIQQYSFRSEFLEILLHKTRDWPVMAVRSSALVEDGPEYSFAGVFSTVLGVQSQHLETAIKEVWSSLFQQHVDVYRSEVKPDAPVSNGIAVIIQQLIPAETAGVAFGINPVSGRRNEQLISAVFGLGEGLVSGSLLGDQWIVSHQEIQASISDKASALFWDHHELRVKEELLPPEKRGLPALNEFQIRKIVEVLQLLYRESGHYQDVEFCIWHEEIYLLQARPISSKQLQPDAQGQIAIWDNNNIIESYPGTTLPLTFSFVSMTYELGYFQLAKTLIRAAGWQEKVVEEKRPYFANMIGLIKGRVYYNIMTYYHLLAMLPGFRYSSRFLESALEVSPINFRDHKLSDKNWQDKWMIFRMGVSLLVKLVFLKGAIKVFLRKFEQRMKEVESKPLNQLQAHDLMYLYKKMEQQVLQDWTVPPLNGFYNMIIFGILRSLAKKWKVGASEHSFNDLFVGEGNIISTEPIKRIMEIAKYIDKDPSDKAFVVQSTPEAFRVSLAQGRFPQIKKMIDDYLKDFSGRCIGGELKLENPTYDDDPRYLLIAIQSYLQQGITDSQPMKDHQAELRKGAETAARATLKSHWLRLQIFFVLLRTARFLVLNRENLRFIRTRAFGQVRKIFREMGRRFAAENILTQPQDIFYLTKEEIFAFISGTSVHTNLKGLVAVRKKDYEQFEKQMPADRIKTFGAVYVHNDFFTVDRPKNTSGTEDEKTLSGVGCSPGVVKGRVRVVHRAEELTNLKGDILVTRSTDPGWISLFPTASAILLEKGGLLSHTGIVTRELGIPCVVQIPGLLQKVKTGDLIEMDGTLGKVYLLSDAMSTTQKMNH